MLIVARSAEFLKLFSPTCSALYVSEALYLPTDLRSRPEGLIIASFAETDVRVRIRGRIVSVHRQRGQFRVVSVVATPEATNRRNSTAALSSYSKNSTSPPAGTPIPLCRLTGGMDFSHYAVAPLQAEERFRRRYAPLLAFSVHDAAAGAETDVRGRSRGRTGSGQRQRGQ